ncbi:hypothetical protein D3C72_732090 [compost metagenome]
MFCSLSSTTPALFETSRLPFSRVRAWVAPRLVLLTGLRSLSISTMALAVVITVLP